MMMIKPFEGKYEHEFRCVVGLFENCVTFWPPILASDRHPV